MISGSILRQGQSPKKNIKIRNSNSITFADDNQITHQAQPFFSQKNTNQNPRNQNHMLPNLNSNRTDNNFVAFSSEPWLQKKKSQQTSILFFDLVKKLQKVSYAVLQAEYGTYFSQNSSYFQWITQIKHQDSIDKLLHSYTSILVTMVQVEQQQRMNFQPKFKLINLDRSQRMKLKLILTQEQENEINKFKNKGLGGYVKKIEDESERYKRQHIRIKQRNRILENELLKLALDFKNKRELYITEISRLTEILHSSFMEVGKMFINVSKPNNVAYPPEYLNRYQNKKVTNLPQEQYNRKNIKSLSPMRNYDQDYVKEEQKLPNFIKAPVKTTFNYESYLKTESVNPKRNFEPFSAQKRSNHHFEVESESAIEQRKKIEQKPPSLMLSAANYSRPKENL